MQTHFTKMHGLGNDFVVIRDAEADIPSAEQLRELADRRTGIGFDQLLWLEPPRQANGDVFYRIFNADGGEVEQCGNGARCIARLIAGSEPNSDRTWVLEHAGGVIEGRVHTDGQVSLNMGVPEFTPKLVPFHATTNGPPYALEVDGNTIELSVVSIGNPHGVITVDDVETAPVETLGPLLERHGSFPNRANIGFMQVAGPEQVFLRVFERGVGETRACGTGACAAVAVGRTLGLLGDNVTVALPGGNVDISWAGPGQPLYLTGDAVHVFEGTVDL